MPRTPIYRKIISDIRAKIESGELQPGDKLPSMRELREQYDVSETVVKTALTVLRELELTEGHQGKGVYVVDPNE